MVVGDASGGGGHGGQPHRHGDGGDRRSASSITYQTADLDKLAFAPGSNQQLIGDENDVVIDASATHQLIDLEAGVVILAWDQAHGRYVHTILSSQP